MPVIMPPGARRISSRATFYYKRVFPAMFFAMPALVLLIMLSVNWGPQGTPVVAWAAPVMVAGIGYLVFKLLLSGLMDEVWVNSADLLVMNESHAEPVPLANIVNISYSGFTNPKIATVQLRHPGRWGDKLRFIPRRSMSGFFNLLGNDTIDDLVRRVDDARRKA